MKMPARLIAMLAPPLLAASLGASAADAPGKQVVWKLVDRTGKVTYVDKAPAGAYDGKVTRIEVDLKANRATLVNVGESAPPVLLPLTAPELKRVKAEAELSQAAEKLEAARKAREAANEPTPEETQWMGKKGGGARPVPTEAYHARVKKLDEALKSAEEDFERARKAARMAAID